MGNNSRNHQIFSVLLNESDEGISFAVASAELQKSIAAWARAGKVAVFDYLDMPEEKRNYTFSNIEPVFIYHPDFTSYLFFNTQEALKTRQDYITLNFSRDLLIRTHKNIIFFVTKEVYENVVRIAHDLNSSIKLRVFFEDEDPLGRAKAEARKDGEAVGGGQAADDVLGDTIKKLREDLLLGEKTVVFGRYPQGANGEVEPLLWRVLDVKGSRVLLITEKLIDAVPYNNVQESVTWETCTLRRWMNEVFIPKAFVKEEASHIAVMPIVGNENKSYGTDDGADTSDQVFALSVKEAMRYFSDTNDRMADVTPYAIARGSDYYTWNERKMFGEKELVRKTGWWWLRSPGYHGFDAALVCNDGDVSVSGYDVKHSSVSVRPALWLNL
jgi:hypothetical protein